MGRSAARHGRKEKTMPEVKTIRRACELPKYPMRFYTSRDILDETCKRRGIVPVRIWHLLNGSNSLWYIEK